jgi:hypothetical protein
VENRLPARSGSDRAGRGADFCKTLTRAGLLLAGERDKPSYWSRDPFRCRTITCVQLSC